jgi:hypothetical protein
MGFVEPRYDVGGSRILALPFADHTVRHNRWYGESARGRLVIAEFYRWCDRDVVGSFVPGDDAARVVRDVTNWREDRISPEDWRSLAAGTGADLVVIGEIVEFRHRQPNDVNVYFGSAAMTYRVISAATGKTLYETTAPRTVEYPVHDEIAIPYAELDPTSNVKRIEAGLVARLGERLGRDLYGYYDH